MAESSITTQAFATTSGESLVWVCKAVTLESYSSLATLYFITLFIRETRSYFPLELFWVYIGIKCNHCIVQPPLPSISRTFTVPDRNRGTLTPCFLSPWLLETGIFTSLSSLVSLFWDRSHYVAKAGDLVRQPSSLSLPNSGFQVCVTMPAL